MNLAEEIRNIFRGEVFDDDATLELYSKDASLFKVRPKLVVFPQDADDLKNLVKWVSEHTGHSVTARAAGSDMTGGPLTESIVADVTKHMNKMDPIDSRGETLGVIPIDGSVWVEPGVFYRDFEPKTLEKGLILPCYTASKSLNALGGMFGNNSAGEKTLRYGQMENFVLESKVIFSDGNEYTVKPLTQEELEAKKSQGDFEGNIYKQIDELIESNHEGITHAKPNVSKNSAGYFLWNIKKDGLFDLNKLFVGSQGTLGIATQMKVGLLKEKTRHDMVALFFKSWDEMPAVINAVMPYDPESLETFDEDTLKLGLRFMPEIAKKAGVGLLHFIAKFIPEFFIGLRMMRLPKLIILVEVAEETEEAVKEKVGEIVEAVRPFNVWHRVVEKDSDEEKFWVMRRESFSLLRKHVKGKRTAPFVEDFCIPTEKVPEFLPRALTILKESGIKANIAGHAGNGNFHIIPLMDLTKESERIKIPRTSEKFYDLVAEYKGSITAEHNDGIVRTPYLGKMYSAEMLGIFKKTKEIFDPKNIFNPGKKVGGTVEYLEQHIDKN